MFNIAIAPTYTHPVEGRLPGGDPIEFVATFRRFSPAQVDEMLAKGRAGEMLDADIARAVLAGWSQMVDASGRDLPFDPDELERVLVIYGVAAAVVRSWIGSLSGAREKN